ncbi:hypothetical protein NQ318_021316 [Aromia moschata]|uniref:Uncharacterized protein n=1 Tax=Aromia moschata TaxID=1265417 RepID=A0AAV8ZC73_9CUCU|nr:hypothetical protein NQ318_021316 [Aromia moschata]
MAMRSLFLQFPVN